MILAVDSDDGIIKIGSPPEELPGIVENIKLNGSLIFENAEVQGRSGRVKVVQGWDDADLSITLSLIDNPDAGITRWDNLKKITAVFKKVTDKGTPEIYTVSHPMISAWGTRQMLLSSVESTETRKRRKVTVSLEFMEYDSSPRIIQERQSTSKKAKKAEEAAAPVTPVVGDTQRRGLGTLEARYASL